MIKLSNFCKLIHIIFDATFKDDTDLFMLVYFLYTHRMYIFNDYHKWVYKYILS